MISADVNADVKQQEIQELVCFTLAFNPLIASVALETSQFICTANRLTGFYVGTTLAVNGLISRCHFSQLSRTSFSIAWRKKRKKIHSNTFCCSLITVLYLFTKKMLLFNSKVNITEE